jgi:hypothetical protein
MTTLTGTSAHTWRDFATRLSAISGGNISVSDSSPDHLAKHLQSNAEANLIIFAECPASLIADRFKEPGTLLDGWKTSAATLLALWRKNRQRVTILNWDECLADPPAFDQWLTSRFGTESSKASLTPSAPQALLAQQVIANVIVARDDRTHALYVRRCAPIFTLAPHIALVQSSDSRRSKSSWTRGLAWRGLTLFLHGGLRH